MYLALFKRDIFATEFLLNTDVKIDEKSLKLVNLLFIKHSATLSDKEVELLSKIQKMYLEQQDQELISQNENTCTIS